MDPFRLSVALGPVAIYVLLLGAINLFRRPFLVSGSRDAAALGLAVSGLVVVGPVDLFFPVAAAIHFGAFDWAFLIALYALCLVLVLLVLRPRLVIYNIATDELRPILADLATKLDAEARWAGDSLVLPNLGVQLHVDGLTVMRNVSLISNGPKQNQQGWRQLEKALDAELGQLEVPRNPRGISLISAGALLMLALILAIASDPQAVFQSLSQML